MHMHIYSQQRLSVIIFAQGHGVMIHIHRNFYAIIMWCWERTWSAKSMTKCHIHSAGRRLVQPKKVAVSSQPQNIKPQQTNNMRWPPPPPPPHSGRLRGYTPTHFFPRLQKKFQQIFRTGQGHRRTRRGGGGAGGCSTPGIFQIAIANSKYTPQRSQSWLILKCSP